MAPWTQAWWIWARKVNDALENGGCCDQASVVSPPFPLERCSGTPKQAADRLKMWAAQMYVWALDLSAGLQACFQVHVPPPTPPLDVRPKSMPGLCKVVRDWALALEAWGGQVKQVLNSNGCNPGDPDPVPNPPPPPFE
jgi:hypothetical protein